MFGDPIENPFEWETAGLTTLGNCKNGMNFGANEKGVEIRCVGVGDIKDIDRIETLNSLTLLSLNELPSKEYLLENGDIVFVRSNGNKNLVGRCVAVYPGSHPLTFSGFCIRFRKTDESISTTYLLQLLKQPSVRAKLVGRGANIQNLNQKMLAALDIPLPPISLQKEYDAIIQQSDKSKFSVSNRNLSRCLGRQKTITMNTQSAQYRMLYVMYIMVQARRHPRMENTLIFV